MNFDVPEKYPLSENTSHHRLPFKNISWADGSIAVIRQLAFDGYVNDNWSNETDKLYTGVLIRMTNCKAGSVGIPTID